MIFGLSVVEIKRKKKEKEKGREEEHYERRFVMFRDVIKSFVYHERG